jgi:hypothetical protein
MALPRFGWIRQYAGRNGRGPGRRVFEQRPGAGPDHAARAVPAPAMSTDGRHHLRAPRWVDDGKGGPRPTAGGHRRRGRGRAQHLGAPRLPAAGGRRPTPLRARPIDLEHVEMDYHRYLGAYYYGRPPPAPARPSTTMSAGPSAAEPGRDAPGAGETIAVCPAPDIVPARAEDAKRPRPTAPTGAASCLRREPAHRPAQQPLRHDPDASGKLVAALFGTTIEAPGLANCDPECDPTHRPKADSTP